MQPVAGLERIARRICEFNAAAATPLALKRARDAVTDTLAVALGGVSQPCTQILLSTSGVGTEPGPCVVYGTARRTTPMDASLINGTAAHALDFDDFSRHMGGHHSAPVVPALLALAEDRGASGSDLLLSYLVGVETEIRLGRAVMPVHYDKGWHPTSTLGTFGAAAACAHLLRLDVGRTANALGMAASLASGLKANFGTMTKPLHVGQCARNGMLAALLAERGFDANVAVLEHEQGFLNVFNGHGLHDASRMLEQWGEPMEIEDESISVKRYPCCGSAYPALIAALDITAQAPFAGADIANVEIMSHARRLRHTDNPHPRTALEAKFSVQYIVARALTDRQLKLRHFEDGAWEDPLVRRVMAATRTGIHPDMPQDSKQDWSAEVVVTLGSGRRIASRIDSAFAPGTDADISTEELWRKFEDCASRSLPARQIAPLFERLQRIDSATGIGDITSLLSV